MHDKHAVGMVMLFDSDMHWRLRWGGEGVIADDRKRVSEGRTGIGRVWIAGDFRGQRLGTELVSYAAKRSSVALCDVVWTIPLTVGGERLVRSLCPDVWLADGTWDDLFCTLGEHDE